MAPSLGTSDESHLLEELFGTDSSTRVEGKLHLRNFFVDLLHEMNDEIDELKDMNQSIESRYAIPYAGSRRTELVKDDFDV